jgi:hypothetical protein
MTQCILTSSYKGHLSITLQARIRGGFNTKAALQRGDRSTHVTRNRQHKAATVRLKVTEHGEQEQNNGT